MKLPICELCSKTNALCSGDEQRLREGKITETDVSISRLLRQLGSTYNLESADFYKSIDLDKVVLVLTRGDVGVLIGREGKVVAEISAAVGKKVRIAEVSGDLRKTVSDIVMPARVMGINTIFREGRKIFKVRFAKSEIKQLPVDVATLEKAMRQLFETDVSVVFE